MHQEDPEVDQRLARFEAQLDRFNFALHQWQKGQSAAAGRDAASYVERLEATLEREADTLRQRHDEPLRELQAQAENLRQICAAAANSVNALDQVESRLVAIQTTVETHLAELSRTLQALAADLGAGRSTTAVSSTPAPAAAWPLDRVLHLHEELRRSAGAADSGSPDERAAAEARPVLPGRLLSAEPEIPEPAVHSRPNASRLWLPIGIVALAALAMASGWWVNTRLKEAATRASAAEQQATAARQEASREAASARAEADRQIEGARQSAQRAEIIGTILSAPDLVRVNLVGTTAERSSGQLLWSRTRGLVLSASRLPPAPPNTTYQLWVVTGAGPVSAGLFVPDATGRATFLTDNPPPITGALVGAQVTVEAAGGAAAPSGRVLLTRPVAAPPAF